MFLSLPKEICQFMVEEFRSSWKNLEEAPSLGGTLLKVRKKKAKVAFL
jgi:hypothetical protein